MLGKMQVKYIQSLYQKKFRDEHGVFIAEGPKLLHEILIHHPHLIDKVYVLQDWAGRHKELLSSLDKDKLAVITEPELKKISSLSTPNEALAVVRKKEAPSAVQPLGKISLLLDGIRDPGNMGTMLRIADWFGIACVICSKDCADVYNPKVIQASMGSFLRVDVMYADLTQFILQHRDVPVFAATLDGESIYELKQPEEVLLVIGNESKGIRDEVLQLASKKITIPARGGAESLNAAVAAGIILSHMVPHTVKT
ncbi:MAG: RNA methyltransferase [Chitinophagaceae bacterium]|nr:RNA methyltransferase [Chitinophagaceae bacterium]